MIDYYHNTAITTLDTEPLTRVALQFHQRLPEYAPTPLVAAPNLAAQLGVRQVWVKVESQRLGLPSFKILGASYATYRALIERLGGQEPPWNSIAELAAWAAPLRRHPLAAATDGNHGRAVAHMAALLGLPARIFVPQDMAQARIDAIAGEGAEVVVVHGSYDDAVARADASAADGCIVIADIAYPGYEEVPRWIVEGYSTLLLEIDAQLEQQDEPAPDVVAVQIGVGSLASAVIQHYRQAARTPKPLLVSVEPASAACALAAVRAGQIVDVPGPHSSIMAGLNCGRVSSLAWPLLANGIDVFCAIDDHWARDAVRACAIAGIESGETGAAGAAGLLALQSEAPQAFAALGLDRASRVLLIVTEGATDPVAYREIVGST